MNKLVLPLAVAVAVVAAGGWYVLGRGNHGEDSLRVSGNIEATEVPISFKIPGHVVARYVDEGDAIYEGKPVARLETADLEADVAKARGEVQAADAAMAEMLAGSRPDEIAAALATMQKAEASYAELKNGSRPQDIEAAEAEMRAADDDRDHLKRDLDRFERLQQSDAGTVAVEQVDRAYAAFHMANQRTIEAKKRYELVKEGPRQEQIMQAKAAMEQAQAQYRLVKEGPRKEDIDQARTGLSRPRPLCRPPRPNSATPS